MFFFSPPAIKDYETASKLSENDRQIKEGLDKAQRLLKQSQKRDYYKILGVKRWATDDWILGIFVYSTSLGENESVYIRWTFVL